MTFQDDAIAKSLAMSDMTRQRAMWLGNTRQNLPEVFRHKDISYLKDLFKDMPGIIVGAGPSLEKNIGLLAEHAQQYPLFCTDRAFRKLHSAGIIPQFTVVVDWQDIVADFFTGMPIDKTTLLGSVKISPKVALLPWKRKVFFLVLDSEEQFNEAMVNLTQRKVSGIPGAIICGNSAYLLARFSGCGPITFVGCDMSMTEPSDDPTDMNYEATDINGNKIYSLPGYLAGLEWLTKYLSLDKDVVSGKVKVYNSTEGGIMYAEMLPPLPLKDFFEQFPGAKSSLNMLIGKRLGF